MRRKSGDRIHNALIISVISGLMVAAYQNCASLKGHVDAQGQFHAENPMKLNKRAEFSIPIPDEVISSQPGTRSPASFSPYPEEESEPLANSKESSAIKR